MSYDSYYLIRGVNISHHIPELDDGGDLFNSVTQGIIRLNQTFSKECLWFNTCASADRDVCTAFSKISRISLFKAHLREENVYKTRSYHFSYYTCIKKSGDKNREK